MRGFFQIAVVLSLFGGVVQAQLPNAELHQFYPPVVVDGEKTHVELVGLYLDESTELRFQAEGADAVPEKGGKKFSITAAKVEELSYGKVRALTPIGLSTSSPLLIAPGGTKVVAYEKDVLIAPGVFGYGRAEVNRVHAFKIKLKSGEEVSVGVMAERIHSKMDAAFWIQDSEGREVASSNDVIGRDPELRFKAAAEGIYTVGVHDLLFRGGKGFGYVIRVEAEELSLSAPYQGVRSVDDRVGESFTSDLPEAQFPFSVEKGKSYALETIADRRGAVVDTYLIVEDADYKVVVENDDLGGLGGATFDDHSRDSRVLFKAGSTGDFRATVLNQYGTGGQFELLIREVKPDFRIVGVAERSHREKQQAYPSSVVLRRGGSHPVRLLVDRMDGHNLPITVEATGLPAGVSCEPITLSGPANVGYLVFRSEPTAAAWNGSVALRAKSGEIEHEVFIGTNIYGVADTNLERVRSCLNGGLAVSVIEDESMPIRFSLEKDSFEITMDGTLEIPIKVDREKDWKGDLVVVPHGLHGLKKPPTITLKGEGASAVMKLKFTKSKEFSIEPGNFSFCLRGTSTMKYQYLKGYADQAVKHFEQVKVSGDESAIKMAEADQKIAKARAKSRNVNFAIYSRPITVNVIPKAPAK